MEKVNEGYMSIKHSKKIPTIVIASYIICGASTIGAFCYPSVSLLLWIGMALVGGIILVVKNKYISDKNSVIKVLWLDIAAMLIGILIAVSLPAFLGLVKQLIVATWFGVYCNRICVKYFLISE